MKTMKTLKNFIDLRIERIEDDIECLDKVCKSLANRDNEIEIELIRNIQADLMFIIDNLKLEKQLKYRYGSRIYTILDNLKYK